MHSYGINFEINDTCSLTSIVLFKINNGVLFSPYISTSEKIDGNTFVLFMICTFCIHSSFWKYNQQDKKFHALDYDRSLLVKIIKER